MTAGGSERWCGPVEVARQRADNLVIPHDSARTVDDERNAHRVLQLESPNERSPRSDPGTILAALREPVFPLGLGQQCCLFSEPVAGVLVEGVDNLEQAVATVPPGILYLPADTSTGTLGDIYATIPAGRDWESHQHGGSTVYRVRALI